MDLAYEYTRKRVDFGRYPKFDDTDVVNVANIDPAEDEHKDKFVERKQTITEINCIPEVSEHWVNTERFIQDDKGMFHDEGGWPKEVNTTEFSEKQRHIRKIETDETFEEQAHELATRAQAVVMQNNSIDVFQTYFVDVETDHTGEPPSAKTVTIFRDPHKDSPRAVSKTCWHPDSANKIAIAYCTLQFQKMPDDIPLNSYIWDLTNPNQPEFTIKPQSPLVTCVFNPKSSEHLAGGCYNGLIGFWDLRKGQTPVAKTQIEQSHNDPVYDIYWIQSRTGAEFCSVSTDGFIYWWDIRKLGSGPMDSMRLESEEGTLYGGTCLEYRTDAGATRFMIGMEQGTLMTVERKAKKDQESQKAIKAIYGVESGRHHGPVYSIERNMAFPKFVLTVGDWAANIWMEDIRTPIMSTPYDPAYLTAGTWSPTRPGVFFTAKKDGVVDVWDYFYKQTEPIVALKIGEHPLTSISAQSQGRMLSLGSQDGSCTILELCSSLVEPTAQEKPAIISMFERETNREKNLQNRLLTQKRQQELAAKGQAQTKEPIKVEVPTIDTAKMAETDNAFWKTVGKFKPDKSKYKMVDGEAGAVDLAPSGAEAGDAGMDEDEIAASMRAEAAKMQEALKPDPVPEPVKEEPKKAPEPEPVKEEVKPAEPVKPADAAKIESAIEVTKIEPEKVEAEAPKDEAKAEEAVKAKVEETKADPEPVKPEDAPPVQSAIETEPKPAEPEDEDYADDFQDDAEEPAAEEKPVAVEEPPVTKEEPPVTKEEPPAAKEEPAAAKEEPAAEEAPSQTSAAKPAEPVA